MANPKNVLVICVDRDDDLGRKANIAGPIIGRRANIRAGVKLALADPGETDANTVFAAVKKFDEVKKIYQNAEVVTLTGRSKVGLSSDIRVNEQLDTVLEQFPADGFIFVSDGKEDDQVIPILQSRASIISKENVVVKEASSVKSTYYSIKEALRDPAIGGVVFGIPGLVLILYALITYLGLNINIFLMSVSFVLGLLLIMKWTGLEERTIVFFGNLVRGVSFQRTSFPFYIAVIFFFAFGLISAYTNFVFSSPERDILIKMSAAIIDIVTFGAISAASFFLGRCIDAVHLKKAFRLRGYLMSIVYVALIWFIISSANDVFVGKADLSGFVFNLITSFAVALVAYKLTSVLDIRKKLTKLLVGLPVYSRDGKWLGKVEYVWAGKNAIEYKDIKTKKLRKLDRAEFVLRENRVFITAAAGASGEANAA